MNHAENEWFIDKNKPIKIGEGKSGLMLLPMLEKDYGGGYENQIGILESGLVECGLKSEMAHSFPFHVPVVFPFKYRRSGWAEEAVDWLPRIVLTNETAQLLFDASQDKIFSQRARQKLKKVVNVWSAERGFCFVRGQH